MFTTESTEFTKKKQHNDSCDSSVTSVYSVVKFVTRSINVNDPHHGPAGINVDFENRLATAAPVNAMVRQLRQ